jgi:hypothetical protein
MFLIIIYQFHQLKELENNGLAYRNRTHIRRVEAYCIIHYTKARNLVRMVGLEPTKLGF